MQSSGGGNAGLIAGLLILALCVVAVFAILGVVWYRHQKVMNFFSLFFVESIENLIFSQ